MTHVITLDECKSYATEANLDKALARTGLDNCTMGEKIPCRFIKVKNSQDRWTAVFLVSEFFNRNKTGGYVCFAAEHGFMSV